MVHGKGVQVIITNAIVASLILLSVYAIGFIIGYGATKK